MPAARLACSLGSAQRTFYWTYVSESERHARGGAPPSGWRIALEHLAQSPMVVKDASRRLVTVRSRSLLEAEYVLASEQAPLALSTSPAEHWVGIVDDDASIRCSLARVFRMDGIRVETFGSAEEFLERTVGGKPDCVVLDVHLGSLSGFDVQDRLVSQGNVPPIVFITAHDDIPSCRLARQAGACGYLRKPFDTEALIALVRALLTRETADCPDP